MSSQIREEPAPRWTRPQPGVAARPLVEGAGTSLMLYQIDPGTSCPVHAHPFPELGLVLAGSGMFVIGEEERPVNAGDSYFVPPNVPHGFRVAEPGEPAVLVDVSGALTSADGRRLTEMVSTLVYHTRGDPPRPGPIRGSPRP